MRDRLSTTAKSGDIKRLSALITESKRVALLMMTRKALSTASASVVSAISDMEDTIFESVKKNFLQNPRVHVDKKNLARVSPPDFKSMVF